MKSSERKSIPIETVLAAVRDYAERVNALVEKSSLSAAKKRSIRKTIARSVTTAELELHAAGTKVPEN